MTLATLPRKDAEPTPATAPYRDRLITTATAETPLGQRARVLCAELDEVIRDLKIAEQMPAPGRWADDLRASRSALLIDLRALLKEAPTDDSY